VVGGENQHRRPGEQAFFFLPAFPALTRVAAFRFSVLRRFGAISST
jgi:hypothetical protein